MFRLRMLAVYAGSWITVPQGISNCPPGLEYLSSIDHLLVHQLLELLEVLVGFETNNKYIVKNSFGQKVYYAVEVSDPFTRNMLRGNRPFDLKIMDNIGDEVIHLNRPLACGLCCFARSHWLHSMEVTTVSGIILGYIEQEWSIFKPSYAIKNAMGEVELRIKGPFCTIAICRRNIEFNVLSAQNGEIKIGSIKKQWSGLAREMFTDADTFGISFPMDLDVKMKAVLLGACFLIDFKYFEI